MYLCPQKSKKKEYMKRFGLMGDGRYPRLRRKYVYSMFE